MLLFSSKYYFGTLGRKLVLQATNGLPLARAEKFDLPKFDYKVSGITLLRLGIDVSMKNTF